MSGVKRERLEEEESRVDVLVMAIPPNNQDMSGNKVLYAQYQQVAKDHTGGFCEWRQEAMDKDPEDALKYIYASGNDTEPSQLGDFRQVKHEGEVYEKPYRILVWYDE